jgi:hypothetical protein
MGRCIEMIYIIPKEEIRALRSETYVLIESWSIYIQFCKRRVTASDITGNYTIFCYLRASVAYWSEFLATDPEVPCSIPGATRFY